MRESEITIEQLNRLQDMLTSIDPEMQELGLVACNKMFEPIGWDLIKSAQIETRRHMILRKAFNLGIRHGSEMLSKLRQ